MVSRSPRVGHILQRGNDRLRVQAARTLLEARRRRTGGDLFVDYGWIKLLYSGDGDMQEVSYHMNQAQWHDKDMLAFRSLLAPGQVAIDVGANMGFLTTLFASIVGPQGKVLSFEPSPTIFAKLEKTVVANGLSQVTAINKGCGAESATLRLNRVSGSSGNSSIIGTGDDSGAIDIDVVRLDDVSAAFERPVRLLKIDTEGYEPMVLEGAERLIAEHRPVIYLEMGGEYVDSTLRSIELLAAAGYDVSSVKDVDWSAVGNGSDYFFLPT